MDDDLLNIQYLTGELVSALVNEFGLWQAADLLEAAAAEDEGRSANDT